MNRTEVASSMFVSAGYDPSTKTLQMQYHDRLGNVGPIWDYAPVEQATFDRMMEPGASIGKIFNAEVKANPLIVGTRVMEEEAQNA